MGSAPSLLEVAADPRRPIQERAAAARALGEAGDCSVLELLRDSDKAIGLAAIEGLGRSGNLRIIEPLSRFATDDDQPFDPRYETLRLLRSLTASLETRVADPTERTTLLLCCVENRKTDVGLLQTVIGVLGRARDLRILEPLSAIMEDKYSGARVEAAHALAALGDPRCAPILIRALGETIGNSEIGAWERGAFISALGELGQDSGVAPLTALENHPDRPTRLLAARSLHRLRASACVRLLASCFSSFTPHDDEAAELLFHIFEGDLNWVETSDLRLVGDVRIYKEEPRDDPFEDKGRPVHEDVGRSIRERVQEEITRRGA